MEQKTLQSFSAYAQHLTGPYASSIHSRIDVSFKMESEREAKREGRRTSFQDGNGLADVVAGSSNNTRTSLICVCFRVALE